MQINARGFNQTHLSQDNRCYMLFGDEPMQKQESMQLITHSAKTYGFTERLRFDIDADFQWTHLWTELQTQSLFSTKRVIICHFSSLVNLGDKLIKLSQNIATDIVLILSIPKLNAAQKKSKWFKTIEKQSLVVGHYELNADATIQWINHKSSQLGLNISADLVQMLWSYNEGNLLAIWQELQKIKLEFYTDEVNAIDYQSHLEQQSQYTPYHLLNAVLSGNIEQMLKVYQVLKQNNIEVLYLINILHIELKTLNTISQVAKTQGIVAALKPYHFWATKENMIKQSVQRHRIAKWQTFLLNLGQLERSAKGHGSYNTQTIWHGLLALLLNISGQKVWTP